MRTNEEWDVIHEAFRISRLKGNKPRAFRKPKKPVNHHYMQSEPLF